MTEQEARKAKVGAPVQWKPTGDAGTITEKGDAGVRVKWDDGTDAIYLYIVDSQLCNLLHAEEKGRP